MIVIYARLLLALSHIHILAAYTHIYVLQVHELHIIAVLTLTLAAHVRMSVLVTSVNSVLGRLLWGAYPSGRLTDNPPGLVQYRELK
jgi:hypothetical protein